MARIGKSHRQIFSATPHWERSIDGPLTKFPVAAGTMKEKKKCTTGKRGGQWCNSVGWTDGKEGEHLSVSNNESQRQGSTKRNESKKERGPFFTSSFTSQERRD